MFRMSVKTEECPVVCWRVADEWLIAINAATSWSDLSKLTVLCMAAIVVAAASSSCSRTAAINWKSSAGPDVL